MTTKKYIALARVSTREQEREGFSLDVQVDALNKWAEKHDGKIVQMWRVAETASRREERDTFKEMIAYAKNHAKKLNGVLVYKIDRAARNIFDYVELERLEAEYGVPFLATSQPTDNTPNGRMQRRILGTFGIGVAEQLSLDVKEGQARRVQEGWFPARPPYGYYCIRPNGRSVVERHPINGPKITWIFQLYADGQHTLESSIAHLAEIGIEYTDTRRLFPLSKIHKILRDRSYIGEVFFRGRWQKGKHQPLVDRATWDKVQAILGNSVRQIHDLTYAGKLITCGHCGHAIAGERVTKRSTGKVYIYYRCGGYNSPGHPRVRLTESELDRQFLDFFNQLRVPDEETRSWFLDVLRARTQESRDDGERRATDLRRQLSVVGQQQDELLNLRLLRTVDTDRLDAKATELRDREERLREQLRTCESQQPMEIAENAARAFELSQRLEKLWVAADRRKRREVAAILLLNCILEGENLVFSLRKPFDVLANGLKNFETQGERMTVELFAQAVAELSPEIQTLICSDVAPTPQPRQFQQPRRLRPHADEPEVQLAA